MNDAPLDRLRAICLALPESAEKLSWGATPTFRVRDKIFAQYEDDHHGSGRVALWCKAPPGAQAILVAAAPDRFFAPPYVGHLGWLGVHLNAATDWDEVAALVRDGYRLAAPKRLATLLDGS